MSDYRTLVTDFLDKAIKATDAGSPSGLAKRLGVAHTTITRAYDEDAKHLLSLKVALAISEISGIPVPQVPSLHPSVGEVINDRNEVAWVRFWRRLEPDERRVMFKTHRIDPPDDDAALRKLA